MQYCWPFILKIALTISNFLLTDTKKVNHLHDNNVNTEAKPRRYRVILLYVPLNWAIPSYGLRPGGRYCPGQSPGNSKEHPTVLPDTSSASPRYCINLMKQQILPRYHLKDLSISCHNGNHILPTFGMQVTVVAELLYCKMVWNSARQNCFQICWNYQVEEIRSCIIKKYVFI